MGDQKKKIQFSEMVNYESVKNLYELNNENHNLSIESSMMLEEFRNTNENQGLLKSLNESSLTLLAPTVGLLTTRLYFLT